MSTLIRGVRLYGEGDPVDVAVDKVVKYTTRCDNQRNTHQSGEKEWEVDAAFGSKEESPDDRN